MPLPYLQEIKDLVRTTRNAYVEQDFIACMLEFSRNLPAQSINWCAGQQRGWMAPRVPYGRKY